MFKAYNIKIDENVFDTDDYFKILWNINKILAKPNININKLFNHDNTLNGKDLIELWFPHQKYDIFLSHSHLDEDLAYKVATYLYSKFNLKTFIDSQVWNHINDLIKNLDQKFAYKKDKGVYDYDVRNVTTAHAHNMLSVALTKMMDSCECIFFLNTKNSFTKKIEKTPSIQTYSSWIYLEAANTSTLRNKKDRESRSLNLHRGAQDSISTESIQIQYDTPQLERFPVLGLREINTWYKIAQDNGLDGPSSLDALYAMNFLKDEEVQTSY
ncbi:MAG: hypothetical protein ABF508_08660 [Zymomonas mobilis]|uniref:hypothetical protein n=1 Tax=Zymomonas mobilis TaxID=542 RepID=UPI0039EAA815